VASEELAAYDDGPAWASGPQLVYDRLAAAALASLPDRLDGATALDVGAGTGAATRELLRRGFDVVAADLSTSMLSELTRQTGGRVPTLVADVRQLGLRDRAYDVTVAAFVLNHLDRPAVGVRELARVTRSDGHLIATTFGSDDHPMKAAVDEVLMRHGYTYPSWYAAFKRDRIPLTATPEAFAAVAADGGLDDAVVDAIDVDLSDLPVAATIGYRLGMAQTAPFVATLDDDRRAMIEAEITAALEPLPPLRLPMLVLSSRRTSRRRS
jgi:ubiquinone/menaquinone biosynthesis C-methylase UbiE